MTVDPAALPERVRARLIGMAADALGAMPADQVPGALRRVAAFTPARRARVAGAQLLAALAADTEFGEHLAIQVRARQAVLVAALEAGERSAETAALAFLLRTDGWEELVAEVTLGEEAATAALHAGQTDAELDVMRERLSRRDTELAELRAALNDARAALKAEQASVRQRIGEARARSRSDLADSETARAVAEEQVLATAAEREALRAELGVLRERTDLLEVELARARRSGRTEREAATMRARLLLDTLLQAGQGLRQELGLPVVQGAPADQVVADLVGTEEPAGVRVSSATGSLAADDPALLRELLALPGFHLVVDGYNVSRDSWGGLTLEEQRARLLRGLAPVAARTGAEMTVVFDAAHADTRPSLAPPRGVRVVFSPAGVIADDVIRDLVAAEPPGRPVGVVTSDQEIVRAVTRRPGVHAVAARALVRLLA